MYILTTPTCGGRLAWKVRSACPGHIIVTSHNAMEVAESFATQRSVSTLNTIYRAAFYLFTLLRVAMETSGPHFPGRYKFLSG